MIILNILLQRAVKPVCREILACLWGLLKDKNLMNQETEERDIKEAYWLLPLVPALVHIVLVLLHDKYSRVLKPPCRPTFGWDFGYSFDFFAIVFLYSPICIVVAYLTFAVLLGPLLTVMKRYGVLNPIAYIAAPAALGLLATVLFGIELIQVIGVPLALLGYVFYVGNIKCDRSRPDSLIGAALIVAVIAIGLIPGSWFSRNYYRLACSWNSGSLREVILEFPDGDGGHVCYAVNRCDLEKCPAGQLCFKPEDECILHRPSWNISEESPCRPYVYMLRERSEWTAAEDNNSE
jgi:hypothetical protein